MPTDRSINHLRGLGRRHPRRVAVLRVGIGIWLLILTAILSGAHHGGDWTWLLVIVAGVHFALAYRLLRVARAAPGPRAGFR